MQEFWSNIFNIAFVAVAGAVSLFFLVSAIVVAAKGKRKCNAFDVILRILSTLVFIAATALVAVAVLVMLDSGLFIRFDKPIIENDPLVPILVLPGSEITLPLAPLFLVFSTEIGFVIGFVIAIVLFLCSLMALTVDCLVANKKVDKKSSTKKQSTKKTPEQLKREAELARIQKIGESAVKKTSEAARAAEAQNHVREDAPIDNNAEPTVDDWRAEPQEQKPAEFVGISSDTDSSFDSFDSFDDDIVEEQPNDAVDEQPITDERLDEVVEEQTIADEQLDEVAEEQPMVEEQLDEVVEEQTIAEEQLDEVVEKQTIAEEQLDEVVEEQTITEDQFDEVAEEQPIVDERLDEIVEERSEEFADSEAGDAEPDNEPQDVARAADTLTEENENVDNYENIEPDRGIYIPEIRTIKKPADDTDPELKPKKSTSAKTNRTAAKTPARSGSTAKRTSASGGAKKSAGSTAKKPAASSSRTSAAKRKPAAAETPEEKKLPVTRRYVILDRRNAVNMFGEYLRERNKADKEKLQSSINTIIIE